MTIVEKKLGKRLPGRRGVKQGETGWGHLLVTDRIELLRPCPEVLKVCPPSSFFFYASLGANWPVWTLVDGEPTDKSVANGWDVHCGAYRTSGCSAVREVQRVSRDDLSVGG